MRVCFALKFLSTPSARRATKAIDDYTMQLIISIHALREGATVDGPISVQLVEFLSTPSARRATVDGPISVQLVEFLSTPSARRATDRFPPLSQTGGISIHALREEGDTVSGYTKAQVLKFLSTPSARRATCMRQEQNSSICISIHALREGGRPHNAGDGAVHVLISIHALREEGDDVRAGLFCSYGRFLSTPSARRATPADLRG